MADVARHRRGAGLAAGPLAGLAEHGRVDVDVAVDAEDDVAEVQRDPDECVLAALPPRAGTSAALPAGGAEERLEDVAEPAESAAGAAERLVAAHVVPRALVGVAQHVVGVGHELEALGCVVAGVHVGVKLPRETPIRLLDVVGGGIAGDAQDLVMVSHIRLPAAARRGSCELSPPQRLLSSSSSSRVR